MWAHVEQVKALLESSWRYHLIGILMAVGVGFFALDQAGRASQGLDGVRKQTVDIEEVLAAANDVVASLRESLLTDYGDAMEESAQLGRLMRDLLLARKNLALASDAFFKATWPELNDRLAFNRNLNILLALLYYNDPTSLRIAPPIQGEPSLLLAEIPLGTIRATSSIAGLHFGDLIRLAYAASIRPSLLIALPPASIDTPMGRALYDKLLPGLSVAASESRVTNSQDARKAAAKLWVRLNAPDGKIREGSSLQSLYDRLTELQKGSKAMEEQATGNSSFQLPVVGQTLAAASALWLLPLIIIALHLLAAASIWQALHHVGSIKPQVDKVGGITSPLLLTNAGVLLADTVQAFIVFIPVAIMIIIAIFSPVVAAQGVWRSLFWLLIILSGVVSAGFYHYVRLFNIEFRELAKRGRNAGFRRVVVPSLR